MRDKACHICWPKPRRRWQERVDAMDGGELGSAPAQAGLDTVQRAAQFMPRRRIVRISGTSNSLAWCPSEE